MNDTIKAGDADGAAHGHHGAVRHARRRRAPVETPPLACDEEAHLDGRVGLAERELVRLARLVDDDRGGFFAPLAEQRELADDVPAFDRR